MNERSGILVVDDTLSSLELIVSTLGSEGYEVRPATSGAQALKGVAIHQPELILLDIGRHGGIGLRMVVSLVEGQLHGRLELSKVEGTRWELTCGKELFEARV